MSENKIKNEYELSPEEEAELDRLLAETADHENELVDYDAIHDAILKKARKEGIAVFAKPKKKASASRIIIGISSAAAVFVVGLAALLIIKNGFGFLHTNRQTAYNDDTTKPGDAVVATRKPNESAGSKGDDHGNDPFVVDTSEPVNNTEDIAVLTTPLPTAFPMKDGSEVTFVLLRPFTAAPDASLQLVPAELPSCMETTVSDTELLAASLGKNEDGTLFCYKCRVITDGELENDYGLAIGVARCVTTPEGEITCLWHVAENCWLELNLTGFDGETAETLLLSLPLCDAEAFDEAA